MGAYEPECLYGHTYTGTASATITGKQTIVVSGNGTVGPAGATAANCIGVAANDAAANGLVPYFPRGPIHISTASGGITAGAQVVTGAAGTVASLAASAAGGNTAGDVDTAANNARAVIGIALTTALDTADVTWMAI